MLSKSQTKLIAVLLYILGAVIIPHSIILFDTGWLDWYLLTFFLFFAPAFLIGAAVFMALDWGLKKLWAGSVHGLIPIVLFLAAPLVVAIATQTTVLFSEWILIYGYAGVVLLWTVLVVALQLWLSPIQKSGKQLKRKL
jgi:hypothetical protein